MDGNLQTCRHKFTHLLVTHGFGRDGPFTLCFWGSEKGGKGIRWVRSDITSFLADFSFLV